MVNRIGKVAVSVHPFIIFALFVPDGVVGRRGLLEPVTSRSLQGGDRKIHPGQLTRSSLDTHTQRSLTLRPRGSLEPPINLNMRILGVFWVETRAFGENQHS